MEFFYRNRSKADSLSSWCKLCCKKYGQSNQYKKVKQKHYDTIKGYLGRTYFNVKTRCENPNAINYERYGERGIKCKFTSIEDFRNYIVNELQIDPRNLTIDRINNNGHYEKGNIRFITQAENNKNKRKIYKRRIQNDCMGT